MVGRLIQQQDVRFLQKQAGQIYTGLFTAGKAVECLNALLRSNTQAVANLIHTHIHIITAAGLEAVDQSVIFCQLLAAGALAHLFFQLLHFFLDAQQRNIGRPQDFFYGVSLRKPGNLRDQTKLFMRIDKNLTGIVIHLSREDVKQRGLTAAVSTKDSHALPFLDLKAQIFQQIFADHEELC